MALTPALRREVISMLRNNNMQVVSRMAGRSLRSRRQQSLTMILAVLLSSFMLFSVMTVGATYFKDRLLKLFRRRFQKPQHVVAGRRVQIPGGLVGKDDWLTKEELAIFRRRKVGFIFQNYNLVPDLTIYENIVLPIELDGNTRKSTPSKALTVLPPCL